MSSSSTISLGISLSQKGGAALLLDGERVLASAVGAKGNSRRNLILPEDAIDFCLKTARINWNNIGVLGIQSRYAPDWADFISSQFGADRSWFESLWNLPGNFREELRFRNQLKEGLEDLKGGPKNLPSLVLSSDELAIAQGIFYHQPDPTAAVLVLTPAFSESDSGLWLGKQGLLEQSWRVDFLSSFEHIVRNLAYYSGFRGRWGERQFLRLSEYGEPNMVDHLRSELLSWSANGELNVQVDRLVREPQHETDWAELKRILNAEPRNPEQPIGSRELDLAKSLVTLFDLWFRDVLAYMQNENKTKNIYIRAYGPVAEQFKAMLKGSEKNLIFVPTNDESLLMASGAAIQAWRGFSDKDLDFKKLELKPQGNFFQPPPAPSVLRGEMATGVAANKLI